MCVRMGGGAILTSGIITADESAIMHIERCTGGDK
jgi:hypothetical protein